jgi:uncharacterized RDD family membrane protein YckC
MACPRCGNDCSCACSGDPLIPSQDWRRQISLQVRAHKVRKHRRLDPDSPLLDFAEADKAVEEPSAAMPKQRRPWWDDAPAFQTAEAGAEVELQPVPESQGESEVPSEPEALTSYDSSCAASYSVRADEAENYERPPLAPFPRISGPVRKIIEFPRSQARCWELADPINDQLRIFEAVEELPPPAPSHLSEIEIAPEEPSHVGASELEIPIQTAPVGQRAYATAVDAAIMIGASVVFGISAQFFAASLPTTKPLLAASAICVLLLLMIYYLLSLSLTRCTPGMQASGLRLMTFKGQPPSTGLLRWRALVTVLSFAALGMGFLWALIDDDRLCWQDRITHTYLARK